MAEQKMVSEREAVMRERAAFERGYCTTINTDQLELRHVGTGLSLDAPHAERLRRVAALVYPLPKVTRPRVVTHGSSHWRYVDGGFQWSLTGEKWESPDTSWIMRPSLVVVLAGLVNEPTEEVEDV